MTAHLATILLTNQRRVLCSHDQLWTNDSSPRRPLLGLDPLLLQPPVLGLLLSHRLRARHSLNYRELSLSPLLQSILAGTHLLDLLEEGGHIVGVDGGDGVGGAALAVVVILHPHHAHLHTVIFL